MISSITVIGAQSVSIRYFERLAAAGITPSVGSDGDSYDIAVESALKGMDQSDSRRLLQPIGNVPSAEAEEVL